jgi:uncharacterized membrane protein YoaK (UPF0700 family)
MDERHGPLPALLLVLTGATGLVDAVSYLGLGRVFVANMTGNVVFLGFALADGADFLFSAPLVALAAFLAGACAGGAIGSRLGRHRARLLAVSTGVQIVLVGAALAASMTAAGTQGGPLRYTLIVLLALAMGLQSAAARRLAVPDLTTTVLTMTLTGFAADSSLAGGSQPRAGRRLLAAATMWLGAAAGALVVLDAGVSMALGLAVALLVFTCIAGCTHWGSAAAWTAGT